VSDCVNIDGIACWHKGSEKFAIQLEQFKLLTLPGLNSILHGFSCRLLWDSSTGWWGTIPIRSQIWA
jgi:hypothetical protein